MKIIMYHYIREKKRDYPYFKNFLHKKNFSKQLKYFMKDLGVISTEQELDANYKKYLLTFDDGLKEQIYAAEILAKKKLTGIFFIPTKPIMEKKFLDVHKIHLLIGKVGGKKLISFLNKSLIFNKYKRKITNKNKIKYSNAYTFNKDSNANIKFKKYMNYLLDEEFRSKILDELFRVFKIKEKVNKFYMNRSDIMYLKKLGMIIGSHAHSHQILSKIKKSEQSKEITKSKKFLEEITKSKINYFCYPFGRKYSYNFNTISILKKKKFKYAFSVESRDADLNNEKEKLELPRYDTNTFLSK